MKIITHDDIVNLGIDPSTCFEWVSYLLEHKDDVILPTKISLHLTEDTYYNIMPSVFFSDGYAGVKVIMRHPDAQPALNSQIMLHDIRQNSLAAVLDASWLTSMRTGAVAAHTISHLAVSDFKTIGVMGLGNTGRAAMKVLLSQYPDRELDIKVLKYKDQHEQFVQLFQDDYPNAHFRFVDSQAEIVDGSDVVISAITFTGETIADDSLFKKGCLVVPIHLRGFMNCDLFFDKVYCDDIDHVRGFKYFDQFKSIAEVAEVVTGRKPGRTSDDERIIAYNVGLSMHDIFYAKKIYEMVKDNPSIPDFNITPPKTKFYI